jgi:tRNA threonylcarbamoyladenosine biosynthesis protein TsaB
MSLILSIESSDKVCSVAISNDYELLSTFEITEDRSHATMLTVLINKTLNEKDIKITKLNAVAVSMGPGSYTGLRIGVSVAKGICYALKIPLIAVNTLQLLCLGLVGSGILRKIEEKSDLLLCPLIDARRMEVYRAFFNSSCEQIGEIKAEIIHENSFTDKLKSHQIIFFGSGSEKCKNLIKDNNAIFADSIRPNASYMVSFAYDSYLQNKFENPMYFEPFYLKDFVATVSKKNSHLYA